MIEFSLKPGDAVFVPSFTNEVCTVQENDNGLFVNAGECILPITRSGKLEFADGILAFPATNELFKELRKFYPALKWPHSLIEILKNGVKAKFVSVATGKEINIVAYSLMGLFVSDANDFYFEDEIEIVLEVI